ncbi:hypothetical protein YYC_02870 [Plasmodium yoelii 17X]|uniref:YIR protein n=1 Tax=Plasmodium yoelii 17X TaxID=1323249 RepID=V7PKM6_PLAYE|nr:hypothetical protein YYC_02870 [Plasmodium yoelii 17X]
MDHQLCGRFDKLSKYLPDELKKTTSNDINTLGDIRDYCSNGESDGTGCKTDHDKINGGCRWLFEQNVVNRINDLSNEQLKVFIIYIMIWLNYMINLKKDGKTNNLNDFYTNYIENNIHYTKCNKGNKDCNITLNDKTGYNNFKKIIEENKYLMNIDINDISNFYVAFKSLCNMYTELDASNPTCKDYLEKAQEFVKKYNELNENSNNIDGSSYRQILSTLSTDYNNFKKYCTKNGVDCNDIPSLSPIKTKENDLKGSEHISEVTSSSSSIASKLIPVLSIFVAASILLGVSYKYSLFGFRKRSQKQHLREKLKK